MTHSDKTPFDGDRTIQEVAKIRRLLTALLILFLFGAAFFAKTLLLPIVIGVLLSLTLSPLVRGAERIAIPPALTASAVIGGLAIALVAFVFLMGGTMAGWMDELPRLGNELRFKLAGLFQSMEAVQDASKQVEDMASGDDEVQRVVVERPALIANAASNVAAFAASLGVGLVLALFLLASGDLFYTKLVQSFPTMTDKKRALKIVYAIERQVSHYLLAIAVINAGLGLAIAGAMYLVGLPYFYMWGLLAFALNFVPFIGALFGVAAVAAVSILTFDTLGYALIAPALYLTLTTLEGQFITPMLVGRRLELNTVSVLLTVIFWAWLWGIPGALLAVPALVVLKVIADNFDRLSVLSKFLSGRDEPAKE